MATIKRAGGRIVTKVSNGVRRVSCSCCDQPTECCLYSSAGFQSAFFMKDLPDRLFIKGSNIELSKTNYTDEEVQAQFNVYENAEEPGEFNIQWVGSSAGWTGVDNLTGGFCLLEESSSETNSLYDDFEDTYTVEILFGDSAGTYTVTRRTTCVWSEFAEGEDFGGVRIIGGSLPDGTMSWSAGAFQGGQADQGFKLGDLNSPDGNYGDFGTTTTLIIVS